MVVSKNNGKKKNIMRYLLVDSEFCHKLTTWQFAENDLQFRG